jgi:hypothetical protein
VRPRRRKAPRRLTARPAESEQPGAEINHSRPLSKATKFAKTAKNKKLFMIDWIGSARQAFRPRRDRASVAEINHYALLSKKQQSLRKIPYIKPDSSIFCK